MVYNAVSSLVLRHITKPHITLHNRAFGAHGNHSADAPLTDCCAISFIAAPFLLLCTSIVVTSLHNPYASHRPVVHRRRATAPHVAHNADTLRPQCRSIAASSIALAGRLSPLLVGSISKNTSQPKTRPLLHHYGFPIAAGFFITDERPGQASLWVPGLPKGEAFLLYFLPGRKTYGVLKQEK